MGSSSNGDFVTSQSMASYPAGSFSENGLESFLGGSSAWNPLVQMPPHRQTDSSSNLFECTRMSTFNNGSSFPSMVGSVDLSECNQFAAGQVSPCSYQEKEEFGDVKTVVQVTDEGGDPRRWCKEAEEASSEDESPSMAHGKKRKRTTDAGDLRTTSDCSQGKDEKKRQSPIGKSSGKQPKNRPQIDGAPKEDYIHVRAKRGQATNSHSLAERVRREKISERMKLLQDLVPGCNKVIGKAVMLDEIINYVQSLQRQVEFLSMKLAAVNPDLNFDIQRILSKEILNARGGGSAALRYGPGLSASHSQLFVSPHVNIQDETLNRTINNSADPLHAANAQFSTIPQISGVWDDEFQGVMHQIDYAGNCISRQP